jgi:hypothetical protein
VRPGVTAEGAVSPARQSAEALTSGGLLDLDQISIRVPREIRAPAALSVAYGGSSYNATSASPSWSR